MLSLKSAVIYLGLNIYAAIQAAKHNGHYIRVIEKDGNSLNYQKDSNPNRINVVTEDSQIIKIVSIG